MRVATAVCSAKARARWCSKATRPRWRGARGLSARTGAAAAILGVTPALEAARRRIVPGVATFATADPACEDVAVAATPRAPAGDLVLVICRGFGGTNAAVVLRAYPT